MCGACGRQRQCVSRRGSFAKPHKTFSSPLFLPPSPRFVPFFETFAKAPIAFLSRRFGPSEDVSCFAVVAVTTWDPLRCTSCPRSSSLEQRRRRLGSLERARYGYSGRGSHGVRLPHAALSVVVVVLPTTAASAPSARPSSQPAQGALLPLLVSPSQSPHRPRGPARRDCQAAVSVGPAGRQRPSRLVCAQGEGRRRACYGGEFQGDAGQGDAVSFVLVRALVRSSARRRG